MQSYGSTVENKSASYKRPSSQALKLQAASLPTFPQRLKLQARVHKLQDPVTRVQAALPLVQGTSNKNKCIQIMFHVKANLMGGKDNFVTFCYLEF